MANFTKMPFLVLFPRNLELVGRDEIFQSISSGHGVTILHGPNGIGKSHIALEYAYRFRTLEPDGAVIWVSSCGLSRLSQSIKEIARNPTVSRPDIVDIPALIHWLQDVFRGNWLLVVDGLSFKSFVPAEKSLLLEVLENLDPSSGRVLITTTISEWEESGFQVTPIPALSQEEAFQLLDGRLTGKGFADNEKRTLIENLSHHPLALIMACSYALESDDFSQEADVLQDLVQNTGSNDSANPGDMANFPQHSVLDRSLGRLLEENKPALGLLYLMAVLDMQGVPTTLLTVCYEHWHEKWRLGFRRALRRLLSLSLIQSSHDKFTVFLDISTQDYIYQRLESNGMLGMWQQKAVEVLAKIFPDSDAIYWHQCESLLPHILTILNHTPSNKNSKVSRAVLLRKLAKYYQALGDYDSALNRKSEAHEIYQTLYGEDHLETLQVETEIGSILYKQQKLVEAEAKLIRVLDRYKATLPENHYLILMHYNSLNAIVQDLGKFKQAEEYAEKALEGYRQIYSETHSDTLIAKWNLATLYRRTARNEKAKILLQELLKIYQKIHNASHPDILETMSTLADTSFALNEGDRSIEMLQTSVDLALKTMDCKHPMVLKIQGTLASTLSKIGRLEEAQKIQRQILDSNLTLHPAPEIQSLVPALHLTSTLERLSRFEEALQVLQPALKVAQKTWLEAKPACPTHPTLLQLQNSFGLLCLRLGRNAEAEDLFHKLVDTNKLVHGENSELRLIAMNNLGGALQRQGKYIETVQVLRDVFERSKKALGARYRFTLRVGNNLAETLRLWAESGTGVENPGELLDEAEKLHREILEARRAVLGEGLDTWVSSVNYGTALQAQRKVDEAERYFDVLGKLEAVAGSKNEVVERGKERLALLKKVKCKGAEDR